MASLDWLGDRVQIAIPGLEGGAPLSPSKQRLVDSLTVVDNLITDCVHSFLAPVRRPTVTVPVLSRQALRAAILRCKDFG